MIEPAGERKKVEPIVESKGSRTAHDNNSSDETRAKNEDARREYQKTEKPTELERISITESGITDELKITYDKKGEPEKDMKGKRLNIKI
jgi:hypothetical protein